MIRLLQFLTVGVLSVLALAAFPTDRVMLPDVSMTSSELAKAINQLNTTWKANEDFTTEIDAKFIRNHLGLIRDPEMLKSIPLVVHQIEDGELPEQFDARQRWPQCLTIGQIRDQGDCGACWAFATVETISDRICIHSPNQSLTNVQISAGDLLSCSLDDGCNGGLLEIAADYYKEEGIVSGGLYNSGIGCQPYPLPGCSHFVNGSLPKCAEQMAPTPECRQECRPGYEKSYSQDKHYGSRSYQVEGDEQQIMKELLTNGPIAVTFEVYLDFVIYRKGVYQRHSDKPLGGHAVKLLGWGVENGVKYWLVANSWNPEWGASGYFKIARGIDECGIESDVVATFPRF